MTDERTAAARALTGAEARRTEHRAQVRQAIAERMPDLVELGEACPYAVSAYLKLEEAELRPTPAAVRMLREHLLEPRVPFDQLRDALLNLPGVTDSEAAARREHLRQVAIVVESDRERR